MLNLNTLYVHIHTCITNKGSNHLSICIISLHKLELSKIERQDQWAYENKINYFISIPLPIYDLTCFKLDDITSNILWQCIMNVELQNVMTFEQIIVFSVHVLFIYNLMHKIVNAWISIVSIFQPPDQILVIYVSL